MTFRQGEQCGGGGGGGGGKRGEGADLMSSADSRGGQGLEGAHGHGGTLHDLLEQSIVVQAALALCTDLGHHLHSLQNVTPREPMGAGPTSDL